MIKAVTMAERLLKDKLVGAKCAVDATCGNGHDTLLLAKTSPRDAIIWAFDIQPVALANTQKLLAEHHLAEKVRLIESCHSHIAEYVHEPVDVAMFNLGYLPGGEISLTTRPIPRSLLCGRCLLC